MMTHPDLLYRVLAPKPSFSGSFSAESKANVYRASGGILSSMDGWGGGRKSRDDTASYTYFQLIHIQQHFSPTLRVGGKIYKIKGFLVTFEFQKNSKYIFLNK